MAIGKASDFTIYQEEFHTGVVETLEQETAAFNAASNGCIVLRPLAHMGDYLKETFFSVISGLVSRRDTTSVAAATDLPLADNEIVGVKLNRKIGPVANTLDSFRKIARDPVEFSFLLGQQIAKGIMVDYVNSAVRAGNAALGNVAALTHDYAATGTLTHGQMVVGMSKLGDAGNRIGCWVMHSKVYYDLMGQAITDKVYEVAGVTIMNGTVPSLGRPVVVTDAAPLLNATPVPDEYHSLGLVPMGIEVLESEGREIVDDMVTGLENLVVRIQGEHAFTLRLKGFTWDVTNGGANPNDTAVALGTNWDQVSADTKSCAGVLIITQ